MERIEAVGGRHGRGGAAGFLAAAAAGLVAATVVFGGAATGRSSATADDRAPAPPGAPGDALPEEAALAIDGVAVSARLVRRRAGHALEVDLRNGAGAGRSVRCAVGLDEATFADAPPYARLVPPPSLVRLLTHPVEASLGPGETRRTSVDLPAGLLAGRAAGRLTLSVVEP